MRKGPRFKHCGITVTIPSGRVVLTIETAKWKPEHEAIAKRAHKLVVEMFSVGRNAKAELRNVRPR